MTQIQLNKEIDKIKKIGVYKIRFFTSFNKKYDDYIYLNVEISRDLISLLKLAIVENEITDFEYYNGKDEEVLKRYKVKTWVFSSLRENYKEFLFLVDLINKGKTKIRFININLLEGLIDDYKKTIKRFTEIITNYSNINMEVNYNFKDNKNE